MTDYTPNISDFREEFVYMATQSIAMKETEARIYFDTEVSAIQKAAEQRGAVRALHDFKTFVTRVIPKGLVNRESVLADLDESMKRLHETGHLLMGPLQRADQIEGDDE